MATKSKGVAEGSVNGAFLCLVEGEVEVIVKFRVFVTFFVIDCRRNDVVLNGKEAEQRFCRTCCTKHVASHRLCRADIELIGVLPKELFDGFGLGDVAYVC